MTRGDVLDGLIQIADAPITLPSGSGHQFPFDQLARRPVGSLPARQHHFILAGGCKAMVTTGAKGIPGKGGVATHPSSREGLCRMLRDRSAPVDLFALVPALQLRFEPELAELDRLLQDDRIFNEVK